MNGDPTAILLAVAATRRNIHEPAREPNPRRTRRVAARVLRATAIRLDPAVAR
jgi:hypothetical protein